MPSALALLAAAASVTFPTTGAKLTVEVGGRTGDLCAITLSRGGQTKVKHVDLNGYGIAGFRMRLRGHGRPRSSVRCHLALRPHLVAGETVITRLESGGGVPTHIRYEVAGPHGFTDLYDRRLDGVFDAWGGVQIQTFRRSTFSADFRRVLFTGTRGDGSRTHVGVLDLHTLKATDLTQQRGRSGCEYSPGFLGRSRPVAGYGSDRVVLYRGGALDADGVCSGAVQRVTSIRHPTTLTPFAGGHPEATLWGFPQGRGMNGLAPDAELVFIGDLPSPDGHWVTELQPRAGVVAARRAADQHLVTADCPAFDDVRLLGWVDPGAFLVRGGGAAYRVDLPSGHCTRLVAGTGFALLPDRSALQFTDGTVQDYDLATGRTAAAALFTIGDDAATVTFNEVGP